jgi:hypothetical protein
MEGATTVQPQISINESVGQHTDKRSNKHGVAAVSMKSRQRAIFAHGGRLCAPCRRPPWMAETTIRPRASNAKRAPTLVPTSTGNGSTAGAIALRSIHVLPIQYMQAARKVAYEVQLKNRNAGVVDRREMKARSSYDISAQGYFGEFMLAHLFRLSMRRLFDTTCRSALSETAFDGTLQPEGWKFDVKVSSADRGELRVQPHKGINRPDLYALFVYVNYVRGKPIDSPDLPAPVLRFDGFIPARDVFDPRYLRGDGNYWVPATKLMTREALWDVADGRRLSRPAGLP